MRAIVVTRPVTGKFGVQTYEGWDPDNRRRVVVKRHADDATARREFAVLERATRCDRSLVVGPAFHRLCFDREVAFGEFEKVLGDEPAHPSIVVQTHPGTGLPFRFVDALRDDAAISAAMRPVLLAVKELHDRTDLVHLGICPGSFARTWSGHCTLMGLEDAVSVGEPLLATFASPALFTCPGVRAPGLAHRGMDMWSCGVMLFRLAHGAFMSHPADGALETPLWRGASREEIIRTVSEIGYSPDMWKIESAPMAASLCAALLDGDIERRPTARQALLHDLFL